MRSSSTCTRGEESNSRDHAVKAPGQRRHEDSFLVAWHVVLGVGSEGQLCLERLNADVAQPRSPLLLRSF